MHTSKAEKLAHHLKIAPLVFALLAFGIANLAWAETSETILKPRDIHVVSGDSFYADGRLMHLLGIDSPEMRQECLNDDKPWLCGIAAFERLKKIVEMQTTPLSCFASGIGEEKMVNVSCFIGDSEVSVMLLHSGHVAASRNASHHYVAAEHAARSAHLGIWKGDFMPPWRWRENHQVMSREQPETLSR